MKIWETWVGVMHRFLLHHPEKAAVVLAVGLVVIVVLVFLLIVK